MKRAIGLVLLTLSAGCARPSVATIHPESFVLRGTDGTPRLLDELVHAHALTVVSFFSASCPCQAAHDARIRALIADETPRDVGVLIVDPEDTATLENDATESHARGYPIVLDDRAALARSLGAEYATYSVVLDRSGKVVYRGGFDSDRSHLREDRTPFLAQAIDDLLAGHAPRHPETKALGCTLELP